MKNLIIAILFLLPITVSAQLLRSYGVVEIGATFPTSTVTGAKFAYRTTDSSFYRWVSGNTWIKIVEPSIDPDTLYLKQLSGTTALVDGDTIDISTYLLHSDTSSMLSSYIRLAGYGLLKTLHTLTVDTSKIATRYYSSTLPTSITATQIPYSNGTNLVGNSLLTRNASTGVLNILSDVNMNNTLTQGTATAYSLNYLNYGAQSTNHGVSLNFSSNGVPTDNMYAMGFTGKQSGTDRPGFLLVGSNSQKNNVLSLFNTGSSPSNYDFTLQNKTGDWSGSSDYHLVIKQGGKIDIGHNGTPTYDVHLKKSSPSAHVAYLAENTSSTGYSSYQLLNNLGYVGSFGKWSSGAAAYKTIATNDTYLYNGGFAGNLTLLNEYTSGNINFAAGGSSTAQMTLASTGNLLLGTTTDVATSILTARSTTKSSSPFPVHSTAESNAITGVENNWDWETGQGLRGHNGTRKFYLLESTFARGTNTYIPYFDANGQVTQSANLAYTDVLGVTRINLNSNATQNAGFQFKINGAQKFSLAAYQGGTGNIDYTIYNEQTARFSYFIDGSSDFFSIGNTSSPKYQLDIFSTDAIGLPRGGNGTRPTIASSTTPFRYNTDSTALEYGESVGTWRQLATRAYARSLVASATWLKPQLEAGNVTINAATNADLFINNLDSVKLGKTLIRSSNNGLLILNPDVGTTGISAFGSGYHTIINGTLNGSNGGTGNIALGGVVTANTSGSNFMMALGYSSNTSGQYAIGLGYNADATADNTLAIGRNSVANENGEISIGSSNYLKMNLDADTINALGILQVGTTPSFIYNPSTYTQTILNNTTTSSITLGGSGTFPGNYGIQDRDSGGSQILKAYMEIDKRRATFEDYQWNLNETWQLPSGGFMWTRHAKFDTVGTDRFRIVYGSDFSDVPIHHVFKASGGAGITDPLFRIFAQNTNATVVAKIDINGGGDVANFYMNRSIDFPAYGTGTKEAADLGKTSSGYASIYATDGTLLEYPISSFPNGIYTGSGTLASSVTRALISPNNKLFFTQKYNSNADSAFIQLDNATAANADRSLTLGLTDTVHTGGLATLTFRKNSSNDIMEINSKVIDQDGTARLDISGSTISVSSANVISFTTTETRVSEQFQLTGYTSSGDYVPSILGEAPSDLFLTTSATTGRVMQRKVRQTSSVINSDYTVTDSDLRGAQDIHIWAYCTNAASDSVVIDLPTPSDTYQGQIVSVYGDGRSATPNRDVYVRCVGAKLWHGNSAPTGETYYQVTSLGLARNSKTASFICIANPDDTLYYWQLIQHP